MKKSLNILVLNDKETNALAVALYCWGHAPAVFDNTVAIFDELKKPSIEFDAVIIDVELNSQDAVFLDELLHKQSLPCLVLNTPTNDSLTYSKITYIDSKTDIEKLASWLGDINKPERVFDEKKPLFTLIYASHAVGETTPSDVMDILKVARKINKELEITGVLLYNKGWWLQVLEGSFSAVTSLFFDHIQKDKRHKNVTLLVLDPSKERQFANWDMGFYSTQIEQDSNLSWTDLDTHPAGELIKQKLSNAQEYTRYFMK
ncbi:MAG: hypothetical protein RL755_1166 [Pseudomonadota bacterium]|jgi:hypothetical protein